MAVLVVSALAGPPSGIQIPKLSALRGSQITKLSALRDSDPQVVRPSGFVRSPSCPPFGIQIPKLSALRGSSDHKLSALRDSDPQVVRPSGFVRSPLSALRDSDHQVVRPSGFQVSEVSALRWEQCLPCVFTCLPVWRDVWWRSGLCCCAGLGPRGVCPGSVRAVGWRRCVLGRAEGVVGCSLGRLA